MIYHINVFHGIASIVDRQTCPLVCHVVINHNAILFDTLTASGEHISCMNRMNRKIFLPLEHVIPGPQAAKIGRQEIPVS